MDEKDISHLMEAGLTNGEARVYLGLLGLGSSSIGAILDRSQVTKSIIYKILDKLIEKGLVSYVNKDGTKYFQAAAPEKILEYLEKREDKIKETKDSISKILPDLILRQHSGKKTEATIYEGFKGIVSVHNRRFDLLEKGDEYYFFGLPPKQPEYFHGYWKQDHRKRMEKGISCRLLYNQKVEDWVLKDRNSFKDCDARRMPIDADTPSWILGYKDVIVIGIPLAEKPFAFEIVNEEVAKSFKAYFEWFWKKSKKEF